MQLTSRPEDETSFSLSDLKPSELELIAALLCNVKLGRGWTYREAAVSLLTKI